MPVQHLSFHGINRAVSDYAASGSCEELINLRPTGNGALYPVRPFVMKKDDLEYDLVFEHKATNATNYIGLRLDRGEDELFVTFLDNDCEPIGEAVSIADIAYQPYLSPEDIHMAAAGNYVVISVNYRGGSSANDKELYINACFLWDGTQYVLREADVPTITVSNSTTLTRRSVSVGIDPDSTTDKAYLAGVISASMNKIQEDNKDVCFGPTLIAVAFKTLDGKTFWTNKWMVLNPIPDNVSRHGTSYSTAIYGDDVMADIGSLVTVEAEDIFPAFYNVHDFGFLSCVSGFDSDLYYRARLSGVKAKLTVSLTAGTWDKDTSMIKSVEIYASKPEMYVDPNVIVSGESGLRYSDYVKHYTAAGLDAFFILLPQVPYDEMEIGNQLLYLQKSIPVEQLTDGSVDVDLEFGGNIQITNDTLDVDSGSVTRYGDILSYNARFHFFDSVAKTNLLSSVSLWPKLYTSDVGLYRVFIVFNDGRKEKVFYISDTSARPDASIVIANDIRITDVILREITDREDKKIYKFRMTPSKRYNYSFCVDGAYYFNPDQDTDEQTDAALSAGIITEVFVDEPNAINVTEQYNPFVFNVDNSYLAPGRVLDLQPQMIAVPDVSYGDYPLNIFTERGVYALLQGNGDILYGAMRPISNLVSEGNGIPTENGTFFLAAGGLWVIAGNSAVLVSDALSRGPHTEIRTGGGYQALCNDTEGTEGGYDVSEYESTDEFKDFIESGSGASLSYNRFRDEIYVSNPGFAYSYALSLKYKQWFKITEILSQDTPGASIILRPDGSGWWEMLDLSQEERSTIILTHMQSRPFSLTGFQYSHVHRLVQMLHASLSGSPFIAQLYGSDDLNEWNLIAYASRTNVYVSQVRTPPAARSWRYYTIVFGGSLRDNADVGPSVIDFEPVIRRIG